MMSVNGRSTKATPIREKRTSEQPSDQSFNAKYQDYNI